jgi:Flp pilus assembly secretin CpaC
MTARPLLSIARTLGVAAGLAAALLLARTAAAEPIEVTLDQAKVMKMPEKVSTVIIGNPLIADVSIQPGGIMVVTGKGYGSTNVVALDRTGTVLMERAVEVRGPREGVIVVYRGVDRESYNCAPNCEQRVTLGDAPKFFDATLNQTVNRTGSAHGGGAAK